MVLFEILLHYTELRLYIFSIFEDAVFGHCLGDCKSWLAFKFCSICSNKDLHIQITNKRINHPIVHVKISCRYVCTRSLEFWETSSANWSLKYVQLTIFKSEIFYLLFIWKIFLMIFYLFCDLGIRLGKQTTN